MTERPILFAAPLVRALLAGTKTQTRRIVTGRALEWLGPDMFTPDYVADPANAMCRYGVPGDRLWVRETFGLLWPEAYAVTNSVTITFVAGETSLASVNELARQPIRLLVGHWYKNRESVMTTGAVPQEISLAYDACINRISWAGGV